jgi:hypothetical protein
MPSLSRHLKPLWVVTGTVLSVFLYVLFTGPEHFYYESTGTLILSPLIYLRLMPLSWKKYVLPWMVNTPYSSELICLVPALILVLSGWLAYRSIRDHSLPKAFLSSALCATVFVTYHFLQPLGITYIAD